MFVIETKVESGERGEDRVAIERLEDRLVVVVADGAGGTGSGAEAAETVCKRICEAARQGTRGAEAWQLMLRELDLLVASGSGGQSTATVVEIDADNVCGASVGDTEAWLVRARDAVDLTTDQERKPLLGSGEARPAAFGPINSGGRLLVATDGLFGYSTHAAIEATVRDGSLSTALDRLAASVVLRSGAYPDDLAMVLGEWAG